MNCSAYKLAISRYLDDDLTPRERSALLAHIGNCPTCAATLARYRTIEVALRKTPETEPSPAVRDRLRLIEDGGAARGHRVSITFPGITLPGMWRLAAAMAALVLVAFAGLTALSANRLGLTGAEGAAREHAVATPPSSADSSDKPAGNLTPIARNLRAVKALERLLQQARAERPSRLALPAYIPTGMRLERFSLKSGGQSDDAEDLEVAYVAQDGKSVYIRRAGNFLEPNVSENARRLIAGGHEWWVERHAASTNDSAPAYILFTKLRDEVIVLNAVLPLDELIRMIESIEWAEEEK